MKKVTSKFFTYFFMAFLIIFIMPFFNASMTAKAAPAHEAHTGPSRHNGWKALSNEADLIELGENGGSGYLTNDIVLGEGAFEICSDNSVYLCLNGYSITMKYYDGAMSTVKVCKEAGFTLYDEKGNSGKITHAENLYGSGVTVDSGLFVMNGGTITGNTFDDGGAVNIYGESAFRMNGGIISNNTAHIGGGVYVEDESEFIMTKGSIKNNIATYRGGGAFFNGDNVSFEMSGGSITGNKAIEKEGGGLYFHCGSFTMKGGSISKNSTSSIGGGICGEETSITIIDGTISKNNAYGGGGIYICDNTGTHNKLVMTGGSISDNVASNYGGGITSDYAVIDISGGIISGNKAGTDGGGINMYGVGMYVSGGEITGNISEKKGGGIFTGDSSLYMTGGTVSGNTAQKGGAMYLGIYESDKHEFSIDGGVIKGNAATDDCNGIIVERKGVITDGICEDEIVCSEKIFSIKFNPNKGSGSGYTQYCLTYDRNKLIENRFTRSGFKFYKWNTKADGSGTSYNDGDDISNKTIVLYAQWKPSKYTVKFDANGGTGTMASQTIKYNTSTALSKNAFTREDYRFKGWNTKANGKGTSYTDGEAVKLKVLNTNKITLYAQWKQVSAPYKVEHYRQKVDGTYPTSANETETLSGKLNTSVTPAVKTYKGFTAPEVKTAKIKADGSLVIKYYYTRNSYKLSWDFAGGKASGTYTKGTVKYGAKITAPVPVKDGYVFNGWDKTVPEKMPANNVTYKATWRKPTNEDQVRNFVGRFYTIILERPADEAGLNDWTGRLLRKEATGAQVAAGFINSDEFQKKKMTDEEYVTKLYRAFFDREPDQAGYEGWLRELKNGKSRDYVLRGFIGSPEFDNLCKKYGINTGSY